jgi:hypothetical protein
MGDRSKRETFRFGQFELVVRPGPGSLYHVSLYHFSHGVGAQYIRKSQYDRMKADFEALKEETDEE